MRAEVDLVAEPAATTYAVRAASATARARHWTVRYARILLLTDLAAVIAAVGIAVLIWAIRAPHHHPGPVLLYVGVSIATMLGWVVALSVSGTRDVRIIGFGPAEYRKILNSSLAFFGLVAVVAYVLDWDLARGYVLVALPAGVVLLLLGRWLCRKWLTAQRLHGRFSYRVLLVGSEAASMHVAQNLERHPAAGYQIVGACVPQRSLGGLLKGTDIPVVGTVDDVSDALAALRADTVVVTSGDELPPNRVRELGWDLDPARHQLVIAPSLSGVAGPRLRTHPVAGLPLIHVDFPTMSGFSRLVKRLFDIVGSSLLIIIGSPVLLAVALGVKLSSPGPIFYRQERIGRYGKPFGMIKFRSMVRDADKQLAILLAQQGTAEVPLFKVTDDPRITPFGRFIRAHSLDELPQLFNVFLGQMSLVGPRPQVAAEVALYDDVAHRRLIMKPGMSGLWQVSGRSSLSWEEALRFDLYYVENWSLTQDILILVRTAKAVIAPGGAAH